ncbi:MAG: ABC transporter ATP-binding protein [Caldilineaceae bacterium]
MSDTNSGKYSQPKISSLELLNITKRFPGVLANDRVSFDVKAGEIHALLGENGAGKSTLMRQLYGLYRPDEGEIRINGQAQNFRSPADAISAGIGMIHQHFMLVPTLTVTENVALGLKSARAPRLDLDSVAARIEELAKRYGLKVDPSAYVWQLAVGEQQRVEIIKALYRGASLLILDEPTAVLTPQEVDEFFVILRQMAADKHSLIFISHKLHEVLDLSHRVTVMRDGRVVATHPTAGMTRSQLASEMVGREVILQYERPIAIPGEALLQINNLWCKGDRTTDALRGVSLELHGGEIVGLAGVSGNGQRELAEVLTGLRAPTQGSVRLNSQDVTHANPLQRLNGGQASIPEERMREGVIKDFSVAENLILRDHNGPPYSQRRLLNFATIGSKCKSLVESFNVKTPSLQTPAKNLSGGNIQKLILARELDRKPSVLIAAQPTRGVDIGASEYIHQRLLEQRANGTAILLISEDLDEIRALSDRIAVMFEGKIVGIVDGRTSTPEQLGLMMAGVKNG